MLKESFKVYKAISEGLINLADHFFEMEYLEAHKGLDIYKESIAANERLQVGAAVCGLSMLWSAESRLLALRGCRRVWCGSAESQEEHVLPGSWLEATRT